MEVMLLPNPRIAELTTLMCHTCHSTCTQWVATYIYRDTAWYAKSVLVVSYLWCVVTTLTFLGSIKYFTDIIKFECF